jgi:hypothetical protein
MRVVAIERFSESSRRCEPSRIAGTTDEVVIWDLALPPDPARYLVQRMPGVVAAWLTYPMSRGERWRLLRACLSTRGAQLGSLVQGPDLWRRVRAGEVDRVAVFSARQFRLATLLADPLPEPARETISRGTKYFGEFGFELLAVIPYAYWLHRQGRLKFTIATADTRCLYCFSPDHEERAVPRRYVPITEYPAGQAGKRHYDHLGFPAVLDTRQWLPPPYKQLFGNDRFRFAKEGCVIFNKTSDEAYLGAGFAVNTFDEELLLALIAKLRPRYQVIYNRPRAADIVTDHQEIREPGDIAAVKRRYPDVLTMQELHRDNADLSFNELQLNVLSNCDKFVSVLGGGAYLASYFGGTNVVYARQGWEVSCSAFENWFHRFSGARVVSTGTPRDLLRAVQRELVEA